MPEKQEKEKAPAGTPGPDPATGPGPVPEPPPIDLDHTLFVIFHGAIAFYDDPGLPWIDVFVADLKDDHVYLCGKFLGEMRIPRGSHMGLTGVHAGAYKFNMCKANYLHYTGTNDAPGARVHLDNVYSRFTLPRPDYIWHPISFASQTDARRRCTVPVFQYSFDDANALRLRLALNYSAGCALNVSGTGDQDSAGRSGSNADSDSFGWTPTDSDPTPLTLHIRAEEDEDFSNVERDVDASTAILGDPTSYDAWNKPVPEPNLPGFSDQRTFWEISLSLRKRIQWLTGVGAAIQRHSPGYGERFTVIAPPKQGDDDLSCGGTSGGN